MTRRINIKSTPLFHMPGMVNFIANIQAGSFQRKAVPSKDDLTRLWFITRSFPTMPSGAALAWATGEAKTSTDGTTLVLEWDDGEEAAGEEGGDPDCEPPLLDQYGEPVPDLGAIPSMDTLDEKQTAQVFAAPWYELGAPARIFVPLDILLALGIEDAATPQETNLNTYQPQRVAEALKRGNYVDGFYHA